MSALKDLHESVWVAPSAELYGRITIGEGSSVWPQVVIRAECQEVRVGRYTNLQDFVLIHLDSDDPSVIGDFCSITHRAVVHGATVEDDCLVGIGAILMNRAVIGRGSIVAPGAVVTAGHRDSPRIDRRGRAGARHQDARLDARESPQRMELLVEFARVREGRRARVGRTGVPTLSGRKAPGARGHVVDSSA